MTKEPFIELEDVPWRLVMVSRREVSERVSRQREEKGAWVS